MIEKWCCHKEKHRTTNLIEAWNHRLKNHLGTNPSLLSFLEMVRIDISTYGTAQARLKANNIPVSRRKSSTRKNEKMIADLTEQYENKKISTIMFLEQIRPYVGIRPKK
ncbi:hypothetical protein HW555_002903 [Spodoptera exigua]|uniref:Uncharacterized protein n=1 Tax=Spodoptera exigua TaxID=7107 RepID=A0A835LDR4_SPOEX|nr:hypothetical protein HW555_002903 [Spodoptera exigua]